MNLVKENDYMDQTFKIKEALELGDNSIVSGIGVKSCEPNTRFGKKVIYVQRDFGVQRSHNILLWKER
jgi:hypothetical protein